MWKDVRSNIDKEIAALQNRLIEAAEREKEANKMRAMLDKIDTTNPIVGANPIVALIFLANAIQRSLARFELQDLKLVENDLKELADLVDERINYIEKAQEQGIEIDQEGEQDLIETLINIRPGEGDKTIKEKLEEIKEKLDNAHNQRLAAGELHEA